MRTRIAALVLATAGLLAGCSSVVDGTGAVGSPGPAGSSPDFPQPTGGSALAPSAVPSAAQPSLPTPSPSAAAEATACPRVQYPAARLTFDCIDPGLGTDTGSTLWPVTESEVVEPNVWSMQEGASHWGPPDGHSLATIATAVRDVMVGHGAYGASPSLDTVADKAISVDGHRAHLLQTTVTLNPASAAKLGTKVKVEKLWIVAIEVGSDDVSLWFTTLPDLVSPLWAKVPATISAIRVG